MLSETSTARRVGGLAGVPAERPSITRGANRTFPKFGPRFPKPEGNKTLQVSELLVAIVKGLERGYTKEKVLHCDQ